MILSSSTIEAVVEELRRIADAPGVAALIVALTSLKPGDRLIIARDETEIYNDLISWRATLKYRTDNGPVDVQYDMAELYELYNLVERGPHWDSIIDIRIVRARWSEGPLTVEEAEQM